MPLFTGSLRGQGGEAATEILYVIADASDRDFAKEFGAIFSERLGSINQDVTERATLLGVDADGAPSIRFSNDPGTVAHLDDEGVLQPAAGNPDYSPIKRITWNDRQIFINAPFIRWGDEPGQQLVVDKGGCSPLIRSNPPSDLLEGDGPPGCDSDEAALDRYMGGQVLAINTASENQTVDMKLHASTFNLHDRWTPYYMVFDSSKQASAELLGIPVVSRFADIDKSKDAVGGIFQFDNGLAVADGGPHRFQDGIVEYIGASSNYTPLWHVMWLYWNINGVHPDEECNLSEVQTIPEGADCGNRVPPNINYDPWMLVDDFGLPTVKGRFERCQAAAPVMPASVMKGTAGMPGSSASAVSMALLMPKARG